MRIVPRRACGASGPSQDILAGFLLTGMLLLCVPMNRGPKEVASDGKRQASDSVAEQISNNGRGYLHERNKPPRTVNTSVY